ncbi:MAG: DUF4840 domain-containing protein [Prevotella sp.]|nr:DUF4840 domain-containing protein [Prevotella sp.]
MKNLKLIFLALGCMAALSLTSCLKSDDDNNDKGLSKAEISECFAGVRGSYTGKLIYETRNLQSPTDTIDVSWSVGTDTLLVLRHFPVNAVAAQINDVDLKKALTETNFLSELKCYLGFYKYDTNVMFYIAPMQIDIPVFYKGTTHTLSVYFWSSAYSYGYKNTKTGDMEVQILMAAAYLDDNENTNYLNSSTSALATIPVVFSNVIK